MSAARGELFLERDVELAAIADALARAADGEGSLVFVEGEAGVGKTGLLQEATARAEEVGAEVLLATGGEVERDLGWGVVRGLLDRTVRVSGERWAGAAALARPIFADGGPTLEVSLGAMLHGLYWLVAQLAEERPSLLVVDDAHWADSPSLRWLAYMAARMSDVPAVIALAVRTGETVSASDLLAAIRSAPATRRLVVSPLTREASDRLVGHELPGSDAGVRDACFHATRGSPFLLHALLEDLRAHETPAAADVAEIQPEEVTWWVHRRLVARSPDAQRLAQSVAVFGLAVPLQQAGALSGLGESEAASAADELARARVFEPGVPLRFTHPLVRGAAYGTLGLAERTAWHARAATILRDAGARPTETAIHLLHVQPRADVVVVETLMEAAEESTGRGDPSTTVVLLRRALREPPREQSGAEVLRRLGLALAALGNQEGFAHLEAALAATPDPTERARLALELSRMLRMGGDFVRQLGPLEAAVDDLPAELPLAQEVEAELMNLAILDASSATVALERIARFRDPEALAGVSEPGMLANLALAAVNAGYSREVPIALARNALERLDTSEPEPSALVYALKVLACCDQLEEAGARWSAAIELGRERGLENVGAFGCVFRGEVNLWAGMLADAEADASLATEKFALWGRRALEPVAILVQVLVERGRLAEAEARLEKHVPTELPDFWDVAFLLCARARLRLAQGRATEALADALDAGERMSFPHDFGFVLNPALLPWRSIAATAMVRDGGDNDRARALAGEELTLARGLGADRALGTALRALAVTQSGDRRLERLKESVEVLVRSPARLEHAHSLCALGSALRRSKHRVEARAHLRDALDRATRCGADALAAEASEELRLAGARPRRERTTGPNALTAAELRVARLAAEGHTNREIAQRLFLTTRTVETHLTHTYQKLDITSRQHLPDALNA